MSDGDSVLVLIQSNRHHLDVGHLFNRIAYALAAQAAATVASVRHGVGAKDRCVVDDHAAEVQTFDRLEDALDVAGENCRASISIFVTPEPAPASPMQLPRQEIRR